MTTQRNIAVVAMRNKVYFKLNVLNILLSIEYILTNNVILNFEIILIY